MPGKDISYFGQGCAVLGSGLSSHRDHALTHSSEAGIIIFISADESGGWGPQTARLFHTVTKGTGRMWASVGPSTWTDP